MAITFFRILFVASCSYLSLVSTINDLFHSVFWWWVCDPPRSVQASRLAASWWSVTVVVVDGFSVLSDQARQLPDLPMTACHPNSPINYSSEWSSGCTRLSGRSADDCMSIHECMSPHSDHFLFFSTPQSFFIFCSLSCACHVHVANTEKLWTRSVSDRRLVSPRRQLQWSDSRA